MLFAADIGNTSIDIGILDDGGRLKMKSKIASDRSKTSDEYAATISGIFLSNGYTHDSISGAVISSVVPSVTRSVRDAVKKLFDIAPIEVGPGIKTGLNIKIDVQSQLGADIVANSVAATAFYKCPLIIADVGTATTFTAINGDGVLEGVIIAPGIRVSLDALAESAAWLTDVSLAPPKHFLGKNTNDSISSGVLYGHAFMIDGFIDKICRMPGFENPEILFTGGLAEAVLPLCTVKGDYDPSLGLKGLSIIYRKNQEMTRRKAVH